MTPRSLLPLKILLGATLLSAPVLHEARAAVMETINLKTLGCKDRADVSKVHKLLSSGDQEAFMKVATKLLRSGSCIAFDVGQSVYVEDVSILSGMACARPKGDDRCFWVVYEAVQKPKTSTPPTATDAPPTRAERSIEASADDTEEAETEPLVLPRIILKSQKQVQAAIGKPDAPCVAINNGLKCSYRSGQIDVVFIKGKADWITYRNPPNVGFYPGALRYLGVECPMDVNKFTVSGDAFHWRATCAGLLSADMFPGEGKAPVPGDFRQLGYIYIKAATP